MPIDETAKAWLLNLVEEKLSAEAKLSGKWDWWKATLARRAAFEIINADRRKAALKVGAAISTNATLPEKTADFSERFDEAGIQGKMREYAELRHEHGMSIQGIARLKGMHRKTIQESIAAANRRLRLSEEFKRKSDPRLNAARYTASLEDELLERIDSEKAATKARHR